MPRKKDESALSRRERQVMDIVYRLGRVSPSDVQERLDEDLSNPAVRSVLRILEDKGHLAHDQEGPRYIYYPTVPLSKARRSALTRVLDTFFGGSPAQAMSMLLDMKDHDLSPEDVSRLQELIGRMKEEDSAS